MSGRQESSGGDLGRRFRFGANWTRFLATVDADSIRSAEDGLRQLLGKSQLVGLTFLDVGCGSGLSSLAARNLGARVHAFDFDPESVEASNALKAKTRHADHDWTIERGDVLDRAYVAQLGRFDIVYSWGVLHHTGAMWEAVENTVGLVAPAGELALALYNDQGRKSRAALSMKSRYVDSGRLGRAMLLARYVGVTRARAMAVTIRDRRNPLARYGERSRGMSWWSDAVDWVGGYPFEVAKPEEVLSAVRPHGFELEWMRTIGGGSGNNEYRFVRSRESTETTETGSD